MLYGWGMKKKYSWKIHKIISVVSSALGFPIDTFNSIQFSFIYIAPNYNNCHLKALK